MVLKERRVRKWGRSVDIGIGEEGFAEVGVGVGGGVELVVVLAVGSGGEFVEEGFVPWTFDENDIAGFAGGV